MGRKLRSLETNSRTYSENDHNTRLLARQNCACPAEPPSRGGRGCRWVVLMWRDRRGWLDAGINCKLTFFVEGNLLAKWILRSGGGWASFKFKQYNLFIKTRLTI